MAFDVRPASLKDFAGDLDVLSAAANEAQSYAAHTRPDASGGSAMVRLLNSTAEVRPTVEAFFEHLRRISDASADELVAAARRYEMTDAAAAAESDAQLGAVRNAPLGGR